MTILADRRRFVTIVKGGRDVVPWRPPDLPTAKMPFEKARPYTAGLYERVVS